VYRRERPSSFSLFSVTSLVEFPRNEIKGLNATSIVWEEIIMKRFAAIAAIPLFAGFLYAQETRTTETHTTTTKTTWNGVLVDAGCRTTHSERTETTSNPNERTSRTETSRVVDCPVTTTTTSFGLLTPEGQYVRFDQPSNTRIVETIKTNQAWNRDMGDRRPIQVRVIGTPNGDQVVLESMTPVTTEGESSRMVATEPTGTVQTEAMFDATYNGDDGKLIIGRDRITWQDLSHTDRSRNWSYAQIKELKRDKGDNAVKIQPYNGGEHKFKIRGPFMNDTVYDMIAERIVASRPH
jgi:hypothetical protein